MPRARFTFTGPVDGDALRALSDAELIDAHRELTAQRLLLDARIGALAADLLSLAAPEEDAASS